MNDEEIITRIQTAFPGAIVDASGADCNYEVYVISDEFKAMNTLQRQKAILALFKDDITSGKLHALSVKARTPEEQSGNSGLVQIQL